MTPDGHLLSSVPWRCYRWGPRQSSYGAPTIELRLLKDSPWHRINSENKVWPLPRTVPAPNPSNFCFLVISISWT